MNPESTSAVATPPAAPVSAAVPPAPVTPPAAPAAQPTPKPQKVFGGKKGKYHASAPKV